MRFAYNRKVKNDPRSEIIVEGTQCNCINIRVMTSANSPTVMSERQAI